MHTFSDNLNRRWTVSVNVATAKRVRAVLGVDLLAVGGDGGAGIIDLIGDPIRFVDVLWLLVESDAARLGVDDEDFGRALSGDAIADATDAFVRALVDFFPNPRDRKAVQTAYERMTALLERGRDKIESALEDPDLERRMVEEFDRRLAASTLGDSSTSSPASPGSTPAR